jgi:quinol monooxygenase YgiN
MKYTMARYSVRPEKLKEVKRAIAEFVAAVRKHEPRTLYLVFREAHQPTFLHLMSFEDEAAERRHIESRYNDHFVKKLYPCCVGRPMFADLGQFAASRAQWRLNRVQSAVAPAGRRA